MVRTYTRFFSLVFIFTALSQRIAAQCNFTGLNANYCVNSAVSTLTPANTTGYFTGPGMVGSTFSPALAGPGTHTINYQICAGNYSYATGVFAPTSTAGNIVSLTDDATSGALPIGFSFQFFCNNYTSFYICSNGFVTFTGGQGSPWTPVGIPNATAPLDAIFFPWTDLNPSLGGSITYSTVGVLPNRKLIVSFNAVPHHNGGNGGDPVTVQLVLLETTNEIEIHTTSMPINTNLNDHLMGLQSGAATPVGTFVTGRNSTNNWSAINEMIKFVPLVTCASSQTAVVSATNVPVTGYPFICSGGTATLTATGNTSYTWSSGSNPSISNASVVNVSPTSNTTYSVTGVNAFGCVANSAITVTLNSGPPSLTVVNSAPSVCLGKTATLTASGALTYTWSNGVSNGVSFLPTTTTNYTVSGQNGCGITTSVTTINVAPLALLLGATPALYCTNITATISATSPGTSYTWQPGNIVNNTPFIIVNPSVTTVYTVSVTDGTCSGVSNLTLTANPAPTIAALTSSSVVCNGGTINLSANGGSNYTWTPGNLNGSSVNVSPTVTTVYTVIGDNSSGCTSNATQIVIVGTQPTLALNPSNSLICNGSSATLTVNGADTYVWSNGPTTNVNIVNPTQLTVYTVIGTNTLSTCSQSASISIDVFTPSVAIIGTNTICNGSSTSFTATGATTYTWEPGGTPFAGITVAPTSNNVYTVSAISSSNNVNCPVTATVEVIVNAIPTVSAAPTKPAVCAKQSNTFTASGATNYTWTTNTNSVIAAQTVTASSSIAATLLYTVTGRDANGCEATAVIPISFNACLGLEQINESVERLSIYPNPSSGNFVIEGSLPMELKLVNELGQEIKKIILNETNGFRVRVNELPNGLYFIVGKNYTQKVIVNK